MSVLLFNLSQKLLVANEVGPEGYKILWGFGFLTILLSIIYISKRTFGSKKINNQFERLNKVSIAVKKNQYILKISIKNRGLTDIQIKQPLLIFKNKLTKRKFNLKGSNNDFYPIKISRNNQHYISVDLGKFYQYDSQLTTLKHIEIVVLDIYNNVLASKKIQ